MKIKKAELKAKIRNIIDRKQNTYAALADGDTSNPQVREMMSRIDAEVCAFRAVLDALNHNGTLLNCY